MNNKVTCPKCLSESAWYARDHRDVFLRCMCGYHKVVATTLEEITIEHTDATDDVTLPKRDTKLWACLTTLVSLEEAGTGEIARDLNYGVARSKRLSVSEVASQLTVLRYKGLVEVLENRKGVVGGSTWGLTEAARKFFKR